MTLKPVFILFCLAGGSAAGHADPAAAVSPAPPRAAAAKPAVALRPAAEPAGYVARLLINETPFPGERGYVSEEDSQATMRELLLVLHCRSRQIPPGYSRPEIADTNSTEILDIITAGRTHRQVDGFFLDANQQPVMAPRVTERLDNLLRIAGTGTPGRFARLLNYAQELATAYFQGQVPTPPLYDALSFIRPWPVTGRAYSWMTDQDCYHPGGSFVRIPNDLRGRLGGNRFYTLQQRVAPPRTTAGTALVTPLPRKPPKP